MNKENINDFGSKLGGNAKKNILNAAVYPPLKRVKLCKIDGVKGNPIIGMCIIKYFDIY